MSKRNYIQPAEFFHETLVCLKEGEINQKLAEMFILVSERYANHPNYVRFLHIREDIIAECIMACVKGFPSFRPNRNIILERDDEGNVTKTQAVEWDGKIVPYDYRIHYNPHAFFTTCATNALYQFLKNEYKQRNICNKMKLELGLDADEGYVNMINDKEAKEKAAKKELDSEEMPSDGIEWEN